MAIQSTSLIKTIERNTKELREDITSLKSDVGEIRVEMVEMKVRINKLWLDYVNRRA